MSHLLSPSEAAHFLGVTPELLFAYAINPPKRHLGHCRILPYVTESGRSGFQKQDLEQFDAYLRDPWADSTDNRPAVPSYIVDYLKVECGGQCPRCGKGFRLANAHIDPWANTRSHHHHNLIRLCSGCHDQFDSKRLIPCLEIRGIKERLIAQVRQRLLNTGDRRSSRLPTPVSKFVGRDHEIATLVKALRVSRSVSIEGSGGIGKTQLLLHALHRMTDERRVLWINVEAYSTVPDIEMALAAAISAPGSPIPASPLSDTLANADVYIVFDGVERMSLVDMDDLVDLFEHLITMTTAPRFVFTSQVELHGLSIESRFRLNKLSDDASLLILRSSLEANEEKLPRNERLLLWLGAFCAGHPLALHLTAGLLRYFKDASIVVDRIRQSGSHALNNPTRRRQTTATSLRTCLLVSYETLNLDQRSVLWIAAHCPAGYLLNMLDNKGNQYGISDLEGSVAELRRWHLLDVEGTDIRRRMRVLSPIRAFVLKEWESETTTKTDALKKSFVRDLTFQAMILDSYVAGGNPAYGLLRFDQEFPNSICALRVAIQLAETSEYYLEVIGAMATSLMSYCFVRGLFEHGVQIMRFGADAAIRLGKKEAAGLLLLKLLVLAQRANNLRGMKAAEAELAALAKDSDNGILFAHAAMAKGEIALLERLPNQAENHFACAARALRTGDPI